MSSARQWWLDLAADMERYPVKYCKAYGKGEIWIYEWIRMNAFPFWKCTPARFRRAWARIKRKQWHHELENTRGYKRNPPDPVAPNTEVPCPVS